MCTHRLITAIVLLSVGCLGCSSARPNFFKSAKAKAGATSSPESFERELSFARLSERHGKVEAAAKIYDAVLEEDPDNQTAHHRLAVMAAQQGRLDDAMKHFQAAYEAGTPDAELLSDIGYARFLQEDLVTAEEAIRAALELDPRNKKATNNLGIVLAQKGQYNESLAQFRKVVGEAEAHSSLAYCQARNGDFALAEQNLHRSLDMNNNQRPAAEALVQLAEHHERLVREARNLQQAQPPERSPAQLATVGHTADWPVPQTVPNVALPMPAVAAAPVAAPAPSPQLTAASAPTEAPAANPIPTMEARQVGPAGGHPVTAAATHTAERVRSEAVAAAGPPDQTPQVAASYPAAVQVAAGVDVAGDVPSGDEDFARYLATAPAAMAVAANVLASNASPVRSEVPDPNEVSAPNTAPATLATPDAMTPTLDESVEEPEPAVQPIYAEEEATARHTVIEEESDVLAAAPQQRSLPRRTPPTEPRRLPPVKDQSAPTSLETENAGISAATDKRPAAAS